MYRAGMSFIRFWTRKWTTMVFFNLVQMVVVNCYVIERWCDPKLWSTRNAGC
jgi:hypothetical protein